VVFVHAFLSRYLSGKPTIFKNHQGNKGEPELYDETIYKKERGDPKIQISRMFVYLDVGETFTMPNLFLACVVGAGNASDCTVSPTHLYYDH
jgi:hypothetical protein